MNKRDLNKLQSLVETYGHVGVLTEMRSIAKEAGNKELAKVLLVATADAEDLEDEPEDEDEDEGEDDEDEDGGEGDEDEE